MSLKLNELVESYKEFYGRNVDQMPKLIAEGRVPINTSQVMEKRLNVRNSNQEVRSAWIDNYFDTGDSVVDHPDGRIKIGLDSKTLREMTPDSPRRDGALILTEDIYNNLQGEEFKKGKVGKTGEWLTKRQVINHPIGMFWQETQRF